MALNFWDYINLSMMMGIRDYYRDKENARDREGEFMSKQYSEIGDRITELFDEMNAVFQQANPNVLPKGSIDGILGLILYALKQVLVVQGKQATIEQNILIDIIFNKFDNLDLGIDKEEFLHSQEKYHWLTDLAGLDENKAGLLWINFFKAVYVTKSEEEVMMRVSKLYSEIVMKFAILGRVEAREVEGICSSFAKGIETQFMLCVNMPENEIDYFGEAGLDEHAARIANMIVELAEDDEEFEKIGLGYFGTHLLALVWEMIRQVKGTSEEKLQMILYAAENTRFITMYPESDLVQLIEGYGGLKGLLENILDGFIVITGGRSAMMGKDELCFEILKEETSFLFGVEKLLRKKYPYRGFGDLASGVMSERISRIAEKVKP